MKKFDIRSYNAVGDGTTNDTAAIRAALDACAQAGGGTVFFPPGHYLTGTLRLPDNTTLHLDNGAVLIEQYQEGMEAVVVGQAKQGKSARPHLICAKGARNIAICGHGEIHGRGASDDCGGDARKRGFRSGVIFLVDCIGVRLNDFTIRHGDAWTVHLHGCEEVFVQGVSILNNLFRRGGNDGLDLNCCRNVLVANCRIEAWDDCIVLKTRDRDTPGDAREKTCENIVVTNCLFRTGCTALKIGSESKGDFRDIHFSNCAIRESSVGFGIYLLDGATVERVTVSDISMEIVPDFRYRKNDEPYFQHAWPISLYVDRRHPESPLGCIRDIVLRDIQACSDHGAVFLGNPDSPIENLTLQNVTLRATNPRPYFPRLLPCHSELLENRDSVQRASDWWRYPNYHSELIPARPSELPPYRPAYFNFDEIVDLRLDNVKVYQTAEAACDNPRVSMAFQSVCNAAIDHCGRRLEGGDWQRFSFA